MTPEEIQALREKQYNATLVSVREANPDLRILRVRPDFPVPRHKPGQYCTLGLGYWEGRAPGTQAEDLPPEKRTQLVRRAYSISCSVLDDSGELLDVEAQDWLEFYVVLVRETGTPSAPGLTPRLFLRQEGDRLFIGEKITGRYTTDPVRPDDAVVFLSTGTGEAPHNYLLWDLLRRDHRGPLVSACCVRYRQDLGYFALHQALMDRFPNYKYLWLTTRDAAAGKKVYIQDLITSGELEEQLGRLLDPARTHVYLCGNPKMIGVPEVNRETKEKTYPATRGVIQILEEKGFRIDLPFARFQGNIHFEEFW